MRHLSEGTLRRMVDEPFAVSDAERAHYAACTRCQAEYTQIAESAGWAASVLGGHSENLDTPAALARVRSRVASQSSTAGRGFMSRLIGNGNRRLLKPGGALVAVLALGGTLAFTPAGSLAANVITVFQPQQVAEVPVTSSDLRTLPDLQQYGTVNAPARVPSEDVSGPAEAASKSGMKVLVPSSLPAGVPSQATYSVIQSKTGSFTFSAEKAQQSAAATGKTIPPMPARINGSTLQVTTGIGVIATYGAGTDASAPPLIVGQMKAPVVTSSGVSVKELENYILSLPGVSPQLAAEIRAISDPSSTLPIPVPVDLESAQHVTVQGVPGLLIGDSTGLGSVVVWEKDGIIHGVGGALTQGQVLDVANGLR